MGNNLPVSFDENSEAKIWLALSDDVKCDMPVRMAAFSSRPRVSFQGKDIIFNDTDFDENDHLLLSGIPCSTNEQCETGLAML
jgi:hypothetical protein